MIRAVLFDMDGTLLDTERISRVAWNRTFDAMGLEMDSEWWFERISGMNIEAIRTFFLNECGDQFPFDEVRQRRHDFYVELVETDGALCKAGVPEVFDTLQQMGIRQAVASSSSEPWVRRCLGVAGVDISLFDVLMTGEKVERSKPDPEIFLRAAALLGVSPEACVVVEDSRNGVLAGHAAGMKTVMIPDLIPCTDELRPLLWHCIDSLAQLPQLIGNYNLESENRT